VSGDQLSALIETIYEAGLDGDLWPSVLAAVTCLVGGIGCTLEVVDRGSFRHDIFYSHGVPKPDEIAYLSRYAAVNPRIAAALRQRPGDVAWDYQILDEPGIDRSPFYAEFLTRLDMRYAVAGILKTEAHEFGAFAVQRSARQGHVGRREIALMRRLTRHVGHGLDVARRLRAAAALRRSMEEALDWLADGVALLDAAGKVRHANAAFAAMAAAKDGIALRRGALEFSAAEPRQLFAAAFDRVRRLQGGDVSGGGSDFAVLRRSGSPAYLLSIRPLSARRGANAPLNATAVLLVRDPLKNQRGSAQLFREALGLSEAEADLAVALQHGTPPNDYARRHALSINTVYTHLKRIKEKTGCHRMAALIRRLNDLQMLPLAQFIPGE
jgi:DNA-binding CsgD family transcriptional regulator/GAF domain-containing protein